MLNKDKLTMSTHLDHTENHRLIHLEFEYSIQTQTVSSSLPQQALIRRLYMTIGLDGPLAISSIAGKEYLFKNHKTLWVWFIIIIIVVDETSGYLVQVVCLFKESLISQMLLLYFLRKETNKTASKRRGHPVLNGVKYTSFAIIWQSILDLLASRRKI